MTDVKLPPGSGPFLRVGQAVRRGGNAIALYRTTFECPVGNIAGNHLCVVQLRAPRWRHPAAIEFMGPAKNTTGTFTADASRAPLSCNIWHDGGFRQPGGGPHRNDAAVTLQAVEDAGHTIGETAAICFVLAGC